MHGIDAEPAQCHDAFRPDEGENVTKYEAVKGVKFSRWPHRDSLSPVAAFRKAPKWSAAHQNQYLPALRYAARPVLGSLKVAESKVYANG